MAITVLLIALVGPLTIAQTGLQRSLFSREQTTAIFLAQEGIESIVKLREDSALGASSYDNLSQVWGDIDSLSTLCPSSGNFSCGVTINDDGTADVYRCTGSGNNTCEMEYNSTWAVPYKQGTVTGTLTNFTRSLQIDVNDAYARVLSTVSWGAGTEDKVVMDSYVYNVYYERN